MKHSKTLNRKSMCYVAGRGGWEVSASSLNAIKRHFQASSNARMACSKLKTPQLHVTQISGSNLVLVWASQISILPATEFLPIPVSVHYLYLHNLQIFWSVRNHHIHLWIYQVTSFFQKRKAPASEIGIMSQMYEGLELSFEPKAACWSSLLEKLEVSCIALQNCRVFFKDLWSGTSIATNQNMNEEKMT